MFEFLLVLSIMYLKSIHIVVSSCIFHSYRFHCVDISWFFKEFFSSKLSKFNDMRFLKTIPSYFFFYVWRLSNVTFFISVFFFFSFLCLSLSIDSHQKFVNFTNILNSLVAALFLIFYLLVFCKFYFMVLVLTSWDRWWTNSFPAFLFFQLCV